MFLKLNLKKKINMLILTLKVLLFILALLCVLTFKNLGIILTIVVGLTIIISILLLHQLAKLQEKLITSHINSVVNNNTLIASNALDSILCQENFTEKNKDIIMEIVNKIDKLKIESYSTKDIAQSVIEKSQKTLMYSSKEEKLSKDSIEKMYILKQKIQIIAELILELAEQTQHISNNIGIVEDIAEQTNMLALNAAVEAARAGEHGKGFAIVASEIRKLADENKQATTKISDLIREIQNVANSTVMVTEEGSKEIENSASIVSRMNENIEELKSNINQTIDDIYKILSGLSTQFDTAEYLSQTTLEINKEIKDTNLELKEKVKTIKTVLDSNVEIKNEIIDD